MKDAVATMGSILPDDAGGRDAVHVAVISAIAGQILAPGQHVGFKTPALTCVEQQAFADGEPIGIVDPFIKGFIEKGQRFWLYLYPRTITSLRHQWTHPAFSDDIGTTYVPPSQRLAAEQWIRAFAERSGCPGYEWLIGQAALLADEKGHPGDAMYISGMDVHGEIPDEFWIMAEIVLGREIKGQKPLYFSCSC